MNKTELRKIYLQKRRELTPEEVREADLSIVNNFKRINLGDTRVIHIFYPISAKNEFNSLLLKDDIRTNYPSIKFVLPKSNLQNNTLTHILWLEDTPLEVNKWGITEPASGTEVPVTDIDLVIIPLLAFDLDGNRLGYGKGFYDRFLATCKKNVLKVGISHFSPEKKLEDVNKYDVPLDVCVTPQKVWTFKLNRK